MIYTVTFNPSLDYIVSVKDFKLWNTNRTDTELMLPGGKGLNVSTVLKNLGMDYVDLYIYHMWDYETPLYDIMDGLNWLHKW